MGHILLLRYIDGPFFIIGTSMGRKFSITGTAIVDISFSPIELVQIAQTLQNEMSMTDNYTLSNKMLCNASARIQSVSAMSINVNCVEFINRIDWVLNIGKGVKRPGEEVL